MYDEQAVIQYAQEHGCEILDVGYLHAFRHTPDEIVGHVQLMKLEGYRFYLRGCWVFFGKAGEPNPTAMHVQNFFCYIDVRIDKPAHLR